MPLTLCVVSVAFGSSCLAMCPPPSPNRHLGLPAPWQRLGEKRASCSWSCFIGSLSASVVARSLQGTRVSLFLLCSGESLNKDLWFRVSTNVFMMTNYAAHSALTLFIQS